MLLYRNYCGIILFDLPHFPLYVFHSFSQRQQMQVVIRYLLENEIFWCNNKRIFLFSSFFYLSQLKVDKVSEVKFDLAPLLGGSFSFFVTTSGF